MEISSIWKYFLLVICIANLIAARRPKHKTKSKFLPLEDELKKGLDLQGLLQRQFFADTALADLTKNAIASPFSALLLLAALARGAVGNSLQELEAGIGFKKEEIEDHFKQVFQDLSYMKNASLCISNKIYLQRGVQLQKEYRQAMQRTFRTTSQRVDFRKKKKTVNLINRWVSKNTNGKIPRMLAESDVGPSVVILLINTLDFVAHWQYPFEETKDLFKTPSGVKTVDMMKRKGAYKYAKSSTLDAEIVSIPYVGGDVEFYIVLPRERNNIGRLMEAVKSNVDALDDGFKRTHLTYMNLIMPIFQTEAKFDLVQIYQELGVQQIFQARSAGLNNMVTSKKYRTSDLHVSKAIHKAYINVTTKGTVAGAASAIGVLFSNAIPRVSVKVDRPFLYFIVAAKQQLFSGIVVDPSVK